jgi:hypothetical protein
MNTIFLDDDLLQLELAEREFPRCRLCGKHTVPDGRADGSVWLACSSLADREPVLARLFGIDVFGGHTRRLVIPGQTRGSAA